METADVPDAATQVSAWVEMIPLTEHVAPLLQTFLWIVFISIVIFIYRRPLRKIANSIEKRIEGGAPFKAGFLEIGEERVQDIPSQRRRLAEEVAEAEGAPPINTTQHGHTDLVETDRSNAPLSKADVQLKYLQAEDLSLRALQAEFGVTIQRQALVDDDKGVDGVFILDGTLNIIEVKFSTNNVSRLVLKRAADALNGSFSPYRTRTFQYGGALFSSKETKLHLIVVVEGKAGFEKAHSILLELRSSYPRVQSHAFEFSELKEKFTSI